MKKAQIRMFESIATMFVFFILLVFGFTFYSRMQEAKFYEKLDELNQLRIVELAERIKNLPELGCSSSAILQQDCFDIIKLEKIKDLIADNTEYYYDLILHGNVSVIEIYPESKTYSIYERQKEQEKEQGLAPVGGKVMMPVALYDAPTKLTHFGILVVQSYE